MHGELRLTCRNYGKGVPRGFWKGGVLKISKFWVRYRNICRMTQGIQWCNPFVEIFDNNQVTAILRKKICKKFDFWSHIIHPPVDMKKLAHRHFRIFSIKIQITLSKIAFSLALYRKKIREVEKKKSWNNHSN